VKVIFTLPKVIQGPGFQNPAPEQWPKAPLAYVEWFTRQAPVANKVHGMYQISKAYDSQKRRQGSIILLSNIRQSCMLFPIFPKSTLPDSDYSTWKPDNILDLAKTFIINNWLSKYSYQTLW
jgi:hypothetical protein